MPVQPPLPQLLKQKIYKTGQTRGADDDVIYQNRVSRNSTVLIPFSHYKLAYTSPDKSGTYDNSFILIIRPEEYFDTNVKDIFHDFQFELGKNTLLFYETRDQWKNYNPEKFGFNFATSRKSPLGGQYVARIPSITSEGATKILHGYTYSSLKGAGIRVYEYASLETIVECRIQLEMIFWHCENAETVARFMGMNEDQISKRYEFNANLAKAHLLDDKNELMKSRIINSNQKAICPLCLEPLSANGFFNKIEQAEGRSVPDLTVTELNLFHIKELRIGEFNHRPYNLAWGHHHCNVVVKDSGIVDTLNWMKKVVDKNQEQGFSFC